METHLSEVTTTAVLAEKKKLRKGFRRFDMMCYTVVAVMYFAVSFPAARLVGYLERVTKSGYRRRRR